MNPMAQSGTHPDADLLNAFAERALPEADRVQVLGHLAECAHCREIAYLAQATAEEETVPATVIHSQPQPGWFSAALARWRVALIPAAALAAVGGVVLWVQLHSASRPVEIAQLATPAHKTAPAPPAPLPQPPVAGPDQSKTESATPGTPSLATRAGAVKWSPEDRQKAPAPRPTLTQQDHLAAVDSAPAVPGRAQAGTRLDGRSAALTGFAPLRPTGAEGTPPYLPAQQQSVAVYPEGRPALVAPAPARAPTSVPPSPGILNVHGEIVTAPALGPSQVAFQSLQQAEPVPPAMNGLPVLRLAKRAKLPSGLNTVSSAVLLNRLVAIDSAGAVFLSQDGGKRWEPVRPQWRGKAIEVQAPQQPAYRLMSAAENRNREMPPNPAQASVEPMQENTNNAPPPPVPALTVSSSPAPPSEAKPVLPGPPMLFKLVTDHHKVWVSPDGKTWREQ